MFTAKDRELLEQVKDFKVVNRQVINHPQKVGGPRGSGLLDDCVRGLILAAQKQDKPYKHMDINKGLQNIFAWGDAFNNIAQNTPLIFADDIRRGWWRCTACNYIQGFGAPPSQGYKCRHCGARREAIVYKEHHVQIKGDPFYFGGHVDMLLELTPGVLTFTELKTCAKSVFDSLEKPMPKHQAQILSYGLFEKFNQSRFVLPKKYRINPDFVVIVYATKEALRPGLWPYKEMPLLFRQHKGMIDGVTASLMAYKKGRENFPNDVPLPNVICSHGGFTSSVARDCQFKSDCIDHYIRYQSKKLKKR